MAGKKHRHRADDNRRGLIGIVTATLASWIVDRVRDETDKRADEAESETEQLRHNVRELTDTVNQLRDDIARLRRP